MVRIAPVRSDLRCLEAETTTIRTSDKSPLPTTILSGPNEYTLTVPWPAYVLVTVVFGAAHVLCALYLLALGGLQLYLDTPQMQYFADLLAAHRDRRLTFWGLVFIVIGLFHLVEVLVLGLKLHLRATRRRSSGAGGRREASGPAVPPRQPRRGSFFEPATWPSRVAFLLRRLSWTMLRALRAVSGRRGFFGVEGRHFRTIFLIREVLEAGSQCVQANSFSKLISRPWINNAYVTLVVCNCFSAPFIQLWSRRRPRYERFACISCDGLLSATVSMLIPCIIVTPYVVAFDPVTHSFPIELMYMDETYVSLVLECRSVFAIAIGDGISKLIPHVSIYMCLRAARSLVRPEDDSGTRVRSDEMPQRRSVIDVAPSIAVTASRRRPRRPAIKHLHALVRQQSMRQLSQSQRALHVLFGVLGVIIIVIHIRAAILARSVNHDHGCKQSLRPWFPDKAPCAIYVFNCYRQDVVSPDQESSLLHLDQSTLVVLILAHCPRLAVPPTIQRFPNLLGFEIWNSTLLRWDHGSAINAVSHPRVMYLTLIHINMTEIPVGILGELPELLLDIEIVKSNITHVPEELPERWPTMALLYFEHTGITSFPRQLLRMSIMDLSLIGNGIAVVDDVLLNQPHTILSLSGNPLEALPEDVGPSMHADFFHLENTRIKTLPSWITHNADIVYAGGSPVCDGDPSSLPSSVVCEFHQDHEGRYPLWLMEPLRTP